MTRRLASLLRMLLLPIPLTLLFACGGGSGLTGPVPAKATKLRYENPTPTPGHFQLVVEAATNDTGHLLLDLMGPTGTVTQGVALFVTTGKGATWGNPGGSDPYAKAGAELILGSPALFKSKVSAGDLQVGLFQTGAPPATLGATPILTLALDLGTSVNQGSVGLAVTAGKSSVYLDRANTKQSLILDLGTLTAQ